METIIIFDDPQDGKLGYLSGESKYSFIIDKRRWPTVEHYVQAKRFEGTNYEEEIREASTIFQVKLMTKPRIKKIINEKGQISTEVVYGKSGANRGKKDWNGRYHEYLYEANYQKFKQNKKVLLKLFDTRNSKLIDRRNALSGPILQKVRRILREECSTGISKEYKLRDFPRSKLSIEERKIIRGVMIISKRISRMEGWDRIFDEMIEDSIYFMSTNYQFKAIEDGKDIVKFTSLLSSVEWTDFYRNFPNSYSIIHSLKKRYGKYGDSKNNSRRKDKNMKRFIILIGLLIFLEFYSTKEQKEIFINKAENARTSQIIIPKLKRKYREKVPPKVKRENPNENPKETPLTEEEENVIYEIIERYDCEGLLEGMPRSTFYNSVKEEMKLTIPSVKNKKKVKRKILELYSEVCLGERKVVEEVKEVEPHIVEDKVREEEKKVKEGEFNKEVEKEEKHENKEEEKKEDEPENKEEEKKEDNEEKPEEKLEPEKEAKVFDIDFDSDETSLKVEKVNERKYSISGEKLGIHLKTLISAGCKYSRKRNDKGRLVADKTKVEYDISIENKILEVVKDDLSDKFKLSIIFEKYENSKIFDIFDTSVYISYLSNSDYISERSLRRIILDLYGFEILDEDIKLPLPYRSTISELFSSIPEYKSYKLPERCSEVIELMRRKITSTLLEDVEDILKNSNKKKPSEIGKILVKKRLEDEVIIPPETFGLQPYEVNIIRALINVSRFLSNEFPEVKKGLDLYVTSFLMLGSGSWVKYMETYISPSLERYYSHFEKSRNVQESLTKEGVSYNISTLEKVMEFYGEDLKKSNSLSIVLAFSLTYLVSLSGENKVNSKVNIFSNRDISEKEFEERSEVNFTEESELKYLPESSFDDEEGEDIFVVIVDSTSDTLVARTSDKVVYSIFKNYPYSNLYIPSRKIEKGGTLVIKYPISKTTKEELKSTKYHRVIACLFCKFYNKSPMNILDTAENRRKWFELSLWKLVSVMKNKNLIFFKNQLDYEEGFFEILKRVKKENMDVRFSIFSGDVVLPEPSLKVKNLISRSEVYGPEESIIPPQKEEVIIPEKEIPDDVQRAMDYIKLFKGLELESEVTLLLTSKLNELDEEEYVRIISELREMEDDKRKEKILEIIEK